MGRRREEAVCSAAAGAQDAQGEEVGSGVSGGLGGGGALRGAAPPTGAPELPPGVSNGGLN